MAPERRDRVPGLLERLRSAGLLPKKRLGQHFLVDPGILESVASAADLRPGDRVFEVGSGPGGLTRVLARRAREVLAVEVDGRMLEFARGELSDLSNVRFLRANVLGRGGRLNPELAGILRSLGPFVWVSNLPYSIAATLIVAMLESDLEWTRAALTIQSEVADRLVAEPGCSSYGPLTLLVSFWADVRLGRRIRPGAFWPPPKVESRVVAIARRSPLGPPEEYPGYRAWVRKLFLGRRKQLGKLLRAALGEKPAQEFLARAGWDPRLRPESLGPEDFLSLARFAGC